MRYSIFFIRMKAVLLIVIMIGIETSLICGMEHIAHHYARIAEVNHKQSIIQEMQITDEMQYFPIPLAYQQNINFSDTYGASRENGGHEGCDILDNNNSPGTIPVISATDGTITNAGWLYLGGYRIGITSKENIYYYYAHLDSYARGIEVGKEIHAGELIGFMGDTGEGEEGTRGNMPVHLHFGIYVRTEDGEEKSVNPYPFLQKIIEE